MFWKKITLLGVGLLGGSLGLAIRDRRLAEQVVGFVRRAASIEECLACGAVSAATCDLLEAVAGADLVVLCTPLGQMQPLVQQMLPALDEGAIVTDVGSVKGSVVRALEGMVAGANAHFVGSHPMAGSERSGVRAAQSDLFQNAVCVVTPTARSNPEAVGRISRLWEAVGGRLIELSPEAHDELASRSSHLPYVLAAQLANFVLSSAGSPEQEALCANGFRDSTRIASGSPEMWRDIVLANRDNLSRALESFARELGQFQVALGRGDETAIANFFASAKERRDQWVSRSASTSPG